MTDQSRLPVLVGVGQITEKGIDLTQAHNPIQLMQQAAYRAAEDAGLSVAQLSKVENLIVVKGARDRMRNPVDALAQMLGAENAKQAMTATGGNMPQLLVNHCAEKIAQGEMNWALLAGGEALDTWGKARKSGMKLDWAFPADNDPLEIFEEKPGTNDIENAHGLMHPANTYPMFENAIRHHKGRDFQTHQQKIGELFAPFTKVAANNPHAWFPIERSAEEIATASADNRYVGFPYTKYMNAVIRVNQAAAVIMCSQEQAKALGVPEEKWVYLHGCGDANDHWHVTERINYHSSPAIKAVGEAAMEMAGCGIDDIQHIDFYSCFPSVVQIARDSYGITENDPRVLTVTGGLPYFGGPGNNYVMHSIVSMVEKLRDNPGDKGLVTGNGWYITKHSAGIYSTEPNAKPFLRPTTESIQAKVDAQPKPEFDGNYSGPGTVETYTVLFDRNNEPVQGLVIGRGEQDQRFLALIKASQEELQAMTEQDVIGKTGQVTSGEETNQFQLN